jgi:hypothetical protein
MHDLPTDGWLYTPHATETIEDGAPIRVERTDRVQGEDLYLLRDADGLRLAWLHGPTDATVIGRVTHAVTPVPARQERQRATDAGRTLADALKQERSAL